MAAGTILRREHLVAACLVGTVVVVVGFASGLGLTHPTTADASPGTTGVPTTTPTTPQAGGGDQGTGGGSGPVNYVGTPIGAGVGGIAPPAATVGTTSLPPVTSDSGQTTTPTTTSTSDLPSTTATVPACQTGLLTGLLSNVTTVVNGVPVVGSLVPGLTNSLLGSCPTTTDGQAQATTTAPLNLLGLLGGGS